MKCHNNAYKFLNSLDIEWWWMRYIGQYWSRCLFCRWVSWSNPLIVISVRNLAPQLRTPQNITWFNYSRLWRQSVLRPCQGCFRSWAVFSCVVLLLLGSSCIGRVAPAGESLLFMSCRVFLGWTAVDVQVGPKLTEELMRFLFNCQLFNYIPRLGIVITPLWSLNLPTFFLFPIYLPLIVGRCH